VGVLRGLGTPIDEATELASSMPRRRSPGAAPNGLTVLMICFFRIRNSSSSMTPCLFSLPSLDNCSRYMDTSAAVVVVEEILARDGDPGIFLCRRLF